MASFEAEVGAYSGERTGGSSIPESGATLDGYEILDVIGRGAYGVTYAARDVASGEILALKLFQPDPSVLEPLDQNDTPLEEALAAFRREAAIVQRLDHPNIVRCRKFQENRERPYIVFELEEGHSLEDYLAGRTIDEASLQYLLRALLGALSHLEFNGILHRDIKPSNIHLRTDGKPILLDFGAARDNADGRLQNGDTSRLTPGYAPPELYDQSGEEGPWSDLYGLAATAYRALTGTPPPAAPDRLAGAVFRPAQEAAAEHASNGFLKLIDRALALSPSSRMRSASEWLQALAHNQQEMALASPDTSERNVTATPGLEDDVPPTQRVRRRKKDDPITVRSDPQVAAGGPAPPRRQRRQPWGVVLLTLVALALAGGGWGYWEWQLWRNKTEWIVDPAGQGDATTISEALRQANDNATIKLNPGTYPESLRLDRPLHLEALSPDPAETIIAPESGPCLVTTGPGSTIKGLTFRKAPGGGGTACLELVSSGVKLENSVIETSGSPALLAKGGGAPSLSALNIRTIGAVPAVVMTDGVRGRLTDSTISGGPAVVLLVRGGAEPEVVGNKIENAGKTGLLIERGAGGRFEGNEIRASGGSGIEIRSGARPLLAKNRVESSGEAGVFIYDGARADLDSNIIMESKQSGIVIADGAAPLLRNNEIRDNEEHGVLLLKGAGGRIEGNRIQSNKGHGIAVSSGAETEIAKNDMKENSKPDIQKGEITSQ